MSAEEDSSNPEYRLFLPSMRSGRSPSHRTYAKSAVIRSNLFFISHGLGTNDVSVNAKATLCSRSTSANLESSHFLFRTTTTNLWSAGSFFKKGANTRENFLASGISNGRKTGIERPSGRVLNRGCPSSLRTLRIQTRNPLGLFHA